MNEQMPGPRRYSEDEVGQILRRATELQRAEPTATDPAGLTLAELEEIAAEAGIDSGMLRQAASELNVRQPATLGSRLAGAALDVAIERVVEGEMPVERLEELVPTIVAATPGRGTASAVGRSLTWSSQEGSNLTEQQVLVACQSGQTLIRVEQSYSGLAAGWFGGIMGGVGGGLGFGLGGALSATLGLGAGLVAFPLTAVVGSFYLARAIYASQVRSRQVAAHALVDRLVVQVEAAIASTRPAIGAAGTGVSASAPADGGSYSD
jgi:hypothetical protein